MWRLGRGARESEKEPKEMERSIGRDGSRQASKESIPS